jgi:cell wall-associated NlpC family hydrolase
MCQQQFSYCGERMRRNKIHSLVSLVAGILLISLFLSGCGHRAKVTIPLYERYNQKRNVLAEMGYSIQVGAFSRVDNAIRLTKSLEKQGLDAFYFAHSSGLYKVRFGDYPSLHKASEEASRLKNLGMIDVYYIVKPGEYGIARGSTPGERSIREEIVDTAQSFIGLPYQWGSCSPNNSLDCSGLVMAVYQLNGLNVPRTSEDQFKKGTPVKRDELKKGDLVFFTTSDNGRVSHVGIYIGGDKFIHAPGSGKTICTDSLVSSYYRDRFYGACTYLR